MPPPSPNTPPSDGGVFSSNSGPPTVAITGSSGMIGTGLSEALRARGDRVVHLVRRPPGGRAPAGVSEVQWSPDHRELDPAHLADVHTVVNLAGAGIGDRRWTDSYKKTIRESRVDSTATVAIAIAALAPDHTPRLISGSAVGYYGDRGTEILTEQSGPGEGFLVQVCQDWENAADAAETAGSSVAFLRTGIVFSRAGGAMAKLLPLAKFGLAGPLGSGRQYWPWITLHDQVRAILHLIDHPEISGAVNLCVPQASPQREVTSALGAALSRPAVLPAPGFALRIALGEFSSDMLASQRVAPQVLSDHGFRFDYPDLPGAMRWVLGQDRAD